MSTPDTFGARCVDNLCDRISFSWFAPRGIISRIEAWRDPLAAAFDALAEQEPARLIPIPDTFEADTAENVLDNWNDYLGRDAIYVTLAAVTGLDDEDNEPAAAEERVFSVTVTLVVTTTDPDASISELQDAASVALWAIDDHSSFIPVGLTQEDAEVLS